MFYNSDLLGQNKNFDVKKPANSFGIELGPSLSQVIYYSKLAKLNNNTVFDFKLGYEGGLFYQYNFNSHFSLRTCISYERKLITSHIEFFNFTTNENEIELWHTFYNYITIPLLAKYNINIKKNRFFIDAGTYIDMLLLGKYKYEYTNHLVKGDITNFHRRFVSGISIGIGTTIPVNKKFDMSFEVRDCYGITRIAKNSDDKKNRTSLNSELFLYSLTYHIPEKK